jgi:hypothetical protein
MAKEPVRIAAVAAAVGFLLQAALALILALLCIFVALRAGSVSGEG